MQIRDHHRRAIDRLADAYRDDPRFLGLIIGGSVAKGYARDDSDVDFLIVATDEVFKRRQGARDLFINRTDLCDYDGGFVDGKIINLAFLEAVANKGNEPSRAASQLSLFAGRLILAHNCRLFPYHKWLPRTLESVPEKPADLMACFNDLLDEPRGDRATALFELVRDFQDWGVSDLEAYTWFMTDVEWSWMSGKTSIEDW